MTEEKIYAADWNDIDSRPVPEWFRDAKFGIFIHWGLYSVPAWSPKGVYAEWYQYWLENKRLWGHGSYKGDEVRNYHDKTYGPDYNYENFADEFKAESFDPAGWAELFSESGAGYVVLTSKHHDGYCLWPNGEADRAWGRKWNSGNTGPQRDLVGDLTREVRKTDVKMCLYYSLYEWFNPAYLTDREKFVNEHFFPQFKDMVNKYTPSLIYTDGEWDMHWNEWRSPEIISWLYNNAPNKDEVVINDRWGKCRQKHGGYYTTEYGSGLADDSFPWEEIRGIGYSFGYNKIEDEEDYKTSRELILMLADIVSRGGNFCLNIGPKADGTIPDIMKDRLLNIGAWLKINGEAIYGTRMWKRACQWSGGRLPLEEVSEFDTDYDIMRLTENPSSGDAVIEAFFTCKDGALFIILPVPSPGKVFVLQGFTPAENADISLIGINEKPYWEISDNNLNIFLPAGVKEKQACVLKITGAGPFVKNPVIKIEYKGPDSKPVVTVKCPEKDAEIRYTENGTVPETNSLVYKTPFTTEKGYIISARTFGNNNVSGDIIKKITEDFSLFDKTEINGRPAAGKVNLDKNTQTQLVRRGGRFGIKKEDVYLTFDLSGIKTDISLNMELLKRPLNWILPPESVEIFTTGTEMDYQIINVINIPLDENDYTEQVLTYYLSVNTAGKRYLRLKFKNRRFCPDWHFGTGNPAWMFIGKISIVSVD